MLAKFLARNQCIKTYQIEYPLAKGTSTISSEEIKEIFNNYSV